MTITLGAATLDVARQSLRFDDRETALTPSEFEALFALAQQMGQPVTRDFLSLRVNGRWWNGRTRAIDVGVGRLRRKLSEATDGHLGIHAVRGVGYCLKVHA